MADPATEFPISREPDAAGAPIIRSVVEERSDVHRCGSGEPRRLSAIRPLHRSRPGRGECARASVNEPDLHVSTIRWCRERERNVAGDRGEVIGTVRKIDGKCGAAIAVVDLVDD